MDNLRIVSFRGPYFFLSNFFPVEIVFENLKYNSAEHAYQAAKTLNHADKLKIAQAPKPGIAKRLGREVTMRPNWSLVKLGVMEKILQIKFSKELHPELYRALQATKGYRLIEQNQHGDKYWGRTSQGGENHLGRLLMKIRDGEDLSSKWRF